MYNTNMNKMQSDPDSGSKGRLRWTCKTANRLGKVCQWWSISNELSGNA